MKPSEKNRQTAIDQCMNQLPAGTKLVEVWAMSQKAAPKELLCIKAHEPGAKQAREHYRFIDKEP